jgi:hypothetical protein
VDAFDKVAFPRIKVEVQEAKFKTESHIITQGILQKHKRPSLSLCVFSILKPFFDPFVFPEPKCLVDFAFACEEDLEQDFLFDIVFSSTVGEYRHEIVGKQLLERKEQVGSLHNRK